MNWREQIELERVRRALESRPQFPDEPGPIGYVETHISSVFLTTGHVFKFKRAVDVGFADFRTLAARRRFCEAELRLNRRLAPEVYLGVLPLWREGADYSLAGGRQVADYCVVMKRLDASSMLERRLRDGPPVTAMEMEALAGVLAAFHEGPARMAGLEAYGSLEVIGGNWRENFAQLEPFIGITLSAERHAALRQAGEDFLRTNAGRLAGRVSGGFIRDGHGDLRCEHICLDDPIRIIDCIEFNDRFRYGDTASDLAFLLMDLTALGRPDLARVLLDHYVRLSGDRGAERLIPFYAAYRAMVRAKVTSLKLNLCGLDAGQREAAQQRASHFIALAAAFAGRMRPPVLVLVAGLMGTGKSALAKALAGRCGLKAFNSDVVRKELAGAAAAEGARAAYGTGIYTADWSARTYEELIARAEEELRAGRSVILDASFAATDHREAAARLAREQGARLQLVECRLDEAATLDRLRRRRRSGLEGARPLSDGRVELYHRQRDAFEPIGAMNFGEHLAVTTDRDPQALARDLAGRLNLPPPLFPATP